MAIHFRSPDQAGPSLWRATVHPSQSSDYPTLMGDKRVEIVVIGSGITGLTTAFELSRHGKKVAVVEANQIGSGTSGDTSAHLTSIPDLGLSKLVSLCGESGAKKVIDSLEMAIDTIEENAASEAEFTRVDSFLYAETEKHNSIESEFKAAMKLQIDCERTQSIPLPFPVLEGIRFTNQARFHPMLYLHALARAIESSHGEIFEKTKVSRIETTSDKKLIVHCGTRKIHCEKVVVATHTPIGLSLTLQTRLIPTLSFVMGVRVPENLLTSDALFWDQADPYHYIRRARDSKGELLLIGGADKKTGEVTEKNNPFHDLKNYIGTHFPGAEIDYQWLSEFFEPADGLPYIGKMPLSDNIFTATGFSGNGLTFGTLSAQLIADEILELNLFEDVRNILRPSRVRPLSSVKNVLEENLHVIKHMVKDRLHFSEDNVEMIEPGEGKTMHLHGQMIAAYRDRENVLHTMSATCPHAGCVVQWNPLNSNWDCPCHGSRFSCTGEVISGPATQALKKVDVENSDDASSIPLPTVAQS